MWFLRNLREKGLLTKNICNLIEMVQVGERDTTYTIPTGIDDLGVASVLGGFFMAKTQTTFNLWYLVRRWAIENSYIIPHYGNDGSDGKMGGSKKGIPIYKWPMKIYNQRINRRAVLTMVSWRSAIIWANALSEMTGLNPVYRSSNGEVIRDSSNENGSVVDEVIQTRNNGYRLPTSFEWEMAARWKNDTESTNGSIYVGERYWTPGSYASGSTSNTNYEIATNAVANCNSKYTRNVGELMPNHLNIYDMSGNVFEWCFTKIDSLPVLRGGCFRQKAALMEIGNAVTWQGPETTKYFIGFRLVRDQ